MTSYTVRTRPCHFILFLGHELFYILKQTPDSKIIEQKDAFSG